jgi:hypothetical protein
MRTTTIVLMTLVLASCDEGHNAMLSNAGAFSPALSPTPIPAVSLQIVPLAVPLATTPALACQSFTAAFDLVIVAPSLRDSSLEAVTLRLVDGSSVGGPAMTFPRAALTNMFGSTFLIGTSAFTFRPTFACVLNPVAITADVVLVDGTGSARTLTSTANLR